MKNSAIPNEAKAQKEGSSLSYTLYASEVTHRILTTDEVNVFRSAFKKHSKDRLEGSVPKHLNCEGILVDHFSHATVNQTLLHPHAVIDPSVYCEFSDEEAVAITTTSRRQARDSFESLRAKTLKELITFYRYYLNNIDKPLLREQKSPINDLIPN